jgi:hypothetical protein
MFKNYLKIFIRNLRRHRGYSLINISGLAIGLTCCILIMLWIQDELSFDRFNTSTQTSINFTELSKNSITVMALYAR